MRPVHHVVLLPVKPPSVGKSRLAPLPDGLRRDLAIAFALDTATSCLAAGVGRVLAITSDEQLAGRLGELGCAVVPDGQVGDLNACLRLAAEESARRWPVLTPVAVCADLPALDRDELVSALAAAPGDGAGFVADARGTGTTLYAAPMGAFDPRFGRESRAAHAAAGALEIPGELTTLRHDVDDVDDLYRALALGVGPCTTAVPVPELPQGRARPHTH
ncbi:MAG: 2-phospho-L-lactate guanylyltransferase [Nocardioides sp.]